MLNGRLQNIRSKRSIKVHLGTIWNLWTICTGDLSGGSLAALKSCEPQIVTEAIHSGIHDASYTVRSIGAPFWPLLIGHPGVAHDACYNM